MRKKIEGDTICDKCATILQYGKEEIFCDHCKKKLTQKYPLRVTIFWKSLQDKPPVHIELCSWACVVDFLRNFSWNKKNTEFVSLPHIAGYSTGNFSSELKTMLEAFSK